MVLVSRRVSHNTSSQNLFHKKCLSEENFNICNGVVRRRDRIRITWKLSVCVGKSKHLTVIMEPERFKRYRNCWFGDLLERGCAAKTVEEGRVR